jgi:two-component system OmpR family sensor kinase
LTVSSEGTNFPQKFETNYKVIEDPEAIYKIYTNSKILMERDFLTVKIVLLEYEGNKYLLINRFGINYLVEKSDEFELHRFVIVAWIFFNILMLILYVGIIRSFYPLKILREKIKLLKAGNLDISVEISSNDEIGFIAKEFNEAIKSLKKNEEVRKWFLRNIAHELKTPITKGKIAIELLEDEKGKQHFEKIFNRLEFLVNQLLMMEKLATKNLELKLECHSLENLINSGISLLLSEDKNNVIIELKESIKIKADNNLFPIALKNLIDNGLKFSEDGKVKIVVENKMIEFRNKGNKPSIDIDMIFEPFIKETTLKNQSGLGLGLYITKFILDLHKISINYKYENQENVFILDLSQAVCE